MRCRMSEMRCTFGIILLGISVFSGCAAHKPKVPPASTQPVSQPAEEAPPKPDHILLRTAMLPTEGPQPFRIQLDEKRETQPNDSARAAHELHIDLSGTLAKPKKPHRDVPPGGVLVFEHIQIEYRSGQDNVHLHYDSATDAEGQGNALADMMVHVKGVELRLSLTPTGRLRDLDGLDAIWRKADMLVAPPPLFAVQWLFRDLSMTELVAEALFPPMPGAAVGPADRWEMYIPANIPMVVRFNSHLTGRLTRLGANNRGEPIAHIDVVGDIINAPSILEGEAPAIRATLQSASHQITQVVDPHEHALEQTNLRRMETVLKLQPPTGESSLEMTLTQTRTLIASRGSIVEASSQPAR